MDQHVISSEVLPDTPETAEATVPSSGDLKESFNDEFTRFLKAEVPKSKKFNKAFKRLTTVKQVKIRRLIETHKHNPSGDLAVEELLAVLMAEDKTITAYGIGKSKTFTTGHPLPAKYGLQRKPPKDAIPTSPATEPEQLSDKAISGEIRCPPETEWKDITFRFEDYGKVSISFFDRTASRSFGSFRFSRNSKNNKPTRLWIHLLNLAVHKGSPPRESSDEHEITVKQVSDIRRGLKEIFPGVHGEPIEKYNAAIKGWPLAINLCVNPKLTGQSENH